MIKYTNNNGVPSAIEKAITSNDFKVEGDISVGQLLDSPQIRILRRDNDIEVDVMDRVWLLMNNAIHDAVAQGDSNSLEASQLLSAASVLMKSEDGKKAGEWLLKHVKDSYDLNDDILRGYTASREVGDWTVYGKVDRYIKSEKKLQFIKVCSVYQYIYPENRKKWLGEVNLCAHLLRGEGYEVDTAEVIAIFKDYSSSQRNKDYPEFPLMTIGMQIYADDVTQDIIAKRVSLHKKAVEGSVPPCTAEDRWNEVDKFAVRKVGGKRALPGGIFDSQAAAEAFLMKRDGNGEIEFRPGSDKRCEKYCAVAHVCPQRAKRLELLADKAGQ
jgi:hypothetical protein